MEKIVLIKDSENNPLLEVSGITVSFHHDSDYSKGNLTGNFSIEGTEITHFPEYPPRKTKMPSINIRLNERQEVLDAMEDGEEKDLFQAKTDNAQAFIDNLQTLITNYLTDNFNLEHGTTNN